MAPALQCNKVHGEVAAADDHHILGQRKTFCLPACREFPTGFLHPLKYPQPQPQIDSCLIVDLGQHAAVLDLVLNTQTWLFPVKSCYQL